MFVICPAFSNVITYSSVLTSRTIQPLGCVTLFLDQGDDTEPNRFSKIQFLKRREFGEGKLKDQRVNSTWDEQFTPAKPTLKSDCTSEQVGGRIPDLGTTFPSTSPVNVPSRSWKTPSFSHRHFTLLLPLRNAKFLVMYLNPPLKLDVFPSICVIPRPAFPASLKLMNVIPSVMSPLLYGYMMPKLVVDESMMPSVAGLAAMTVLLSMAPCSML